MRVDARDHVTPPHNVCCARKSGLGRRLVAGFEEVRNIVRALVPNRRRAGLRSPCGVGDRRQRLVIDCDQIRRVLRQRHSFGDDHCDRIAEMPHAVADKPRVRARKHRRAVGPLALQPHRHRAKPVARDIFAGIDRENPRSDGRGGVDRPNPCMRVRRAQEHRIGLPRQVHIVLVTTLAAQQARILKPGNRLPNAVFGHSWFRSPHPSLPRKRRRVGEGACGRGGERLL
jgi:hypothetical protein